MAVTVGEVCAEVNNYFVSTGDIHKGDFQISGGAITPSDFLLTNQYFRIVGSKMNDGVYKNDNTSLASLVDESFSGSIWSMSVPPAFVKTCEKINEWYNKYGGVNGAAASPYVSESFAGYSYTKASKDVGSNGSSWQSIFADSLNIWRRI